MAKDTPRATEGITIGIFTSASRMGVALPIFFLAINIATGSPRMTLTAVAVIPIVYERVMLPQNWFQGSTPLMALINVPSVIAYVIGSMIKRDGIMTKLRNTANVKQSLILTDKAELSLRSKFGQAFLTGSFMHGPNVFMAKKIVMDRKISMELTL